MKKILIFICVILTIVAIVCDRFLVDKKAPTLTLKKTPVLACGIDINNLTDYIDAEDDNLKTVFVEENNLLSILDLNRVTFVAIDKANNVSKLSTSINIEDNVNSFYIEEIKPLEVSISEELRIDDFFVIKNSCGWQDEEIVSISDVDFNTCGEYSAIISSNNRNCQNIYALCKIINGETPIIHLSDYYIQSGTNKYYNDYYFKSLIESIENNTQNILIDNVKVNWQDVLEIDENGNVKEGMYLITYSIVDENDNISASTLRLDVSEGYNIEEKVIEEYVYIEDEYIDYIAEE